MQLVGRRIGSTAATQTYVGLGLAVMLLALGVVGSQSVIDLVTEILIMAVYAMSYNLVFGTAGLMSFGHALFFGAGAYTLGILTKDFGAPLWLAILAAALVGLALSALVGSLSLHLTWLYFALLTFAFAQIIYTIVFKARPITGGDDGLIGIPLPPWLNSASQVYFLVLAACIACTVLLLLIHNSPFGAILRSIRENPERVRFCGFNVRAYRLTAFMIGGMFAAVAGSLFTVLNRAAFVNYLDVQMFNTAIFSVLMGGMSTFFGPVIGAVIMVALNKLLGSVTEYWSMVTGIILVLIILFFPQGILGFIHERTRAWRR